MDTFTNNISNEDFNSLTQETQHLINQIKTKFERDHLFSSHPFSKLFKVIIEDAKESEWKGYQFLQLTVSLEYNQNPNKNYIEEAWEIFLEEIIDQPSLITREQEFIKRETCKLTLVELFNREAL
jgi:hypothetical protein